MKVFRLIFALALVVAGVLLLLIRPISAQTVVAPSAVKPVTAPVLTRITVVDAGTAGKPDVVLIPGMGSSRAVWDAEGLQALAPNYRLHLVQLNGWCGGTSGGRQCHRTRRHQRDSAGRGRRPSCVHHGTGDAPGGGGALDGRVAGADACGQISGRRAQDGDRGNAAVLWNGL